FRLGWRGLWGGFPRGCWTSGRWRIFRISEHCLRLLWVGRAVLFLRIRERDRPRAFRAPGGPLAPVVTIITCVLLMAGLPIMNWIRFSSGLPIGLVIYYLYGRRKSPLRVSAPAQ